MEASSANEPVITGATPGSAVWSVAQVADLADRLPMMIAYWDSDLRNVFANRAYLDWVGKRWVDVYGLPVRDLVGAVGDARILPLISAALAGRAAELDSSPTDSSGRARQINTMVIPRVVDGVVEGIYTVGTDITDRLESQAVERAEAQQIATLIERERISDELHDDVLQRLFAVVLELEHAARSFPLADSTAAAVQAVIGDLSALTRTVASDSTREAGRLPWTIAELVSVLDHVPALIGFWDNDLRCRFVNKFGADWFGASRTALRGRHVQDLLGPDIYRRNVPYIQAVLTGQPQRFEREFPQLNGHSRVLRLSYEPNLVNGRVDGFFILGIDVSEQMQADTELQESAQQVAVLDERQRIAADLHDVVIQRLYATGIDVQSLQRELGAEHSARLDAIAEAVDDTILELRASIHNLRTGMTGVEPDAAVLRLIRQAGRTLGFAPAMTVRGTLSDLPAAVLAHLLAVLGEALTNVSRHADATRVDIAITISAEDLIVEVADNGRGLGQVNVKGGLANLGDRAAALGGTFDLRAGEPTGTVLSWQVPVIGSGTRTRTAL